MIPTEQLAAEARAFALAEAWCDDFERSMRWLCLADGGPPTERRPTYWSQPIPVRLAKLRVTP